MDCRLFLIHSDLESKTSEFVHQYVERFRDIWSAHVLAFHDSFVCLRATDHVIGLDRKDLLEDVRRTECLDRPNLHFSEALSTKLCFTTQRLLRDERVRSDRTCV